MVSHDAPTVSARFVYGSSTTHDGSATIHPGGLRMLTMRPQFDTVLVRFKPVAPRPPPHTVFVMNWVVDENNFSVMLGRSNRSLGITSTFGGVNVPCSRTQHGLTRVGLEPPTSRSGVRGINNQATALPGLG